MTNSKSVKVTGKKEEQLLYRKHTMFAGGLKETPYKVMKEKRPEEVRHLANSNITQSNHRTFLNRLFLSTRTRIVHSARMEPYRLEIPPPSAGHPTLDHPTRCLGHVTQEQAASTPTRAPQSLLWPPYGHRWRQPPQKMGRRYPPRRLRPLCTPNVKNAESFGREESSGTAGSVISLHTHVDCPSPSVLGFSAYH